MLGRHVDLTFGVIEMQFHFCRGLVFSISLPPRYSLSLSLLLLISTSAAIAQVPSGSKVISRIEESSDWETCGNCGNTGGSGSLATFSMIRGIGTPNLDGSSTKFQVGGSHPFKNAYWYIKRYSSAPTTPLKYLKYEFYVYVPSGYGSAPQAIEFECQQKVGGYLYNFAWQANYASHSWRTYDFVKHEWQSSGIGFSALSTGKWHHIVAEFHTSNRAVVHDAITLDGTRHAVNIHHAAKSWNSGHYLTNAFQLDLNGNPTPYHVYVDKMSVTYK